MSPHLHPVAAVPTSGPANVSAFATTSSSILVRWGEVPHTERNGLILGYKVRSIDQILKPVKKLN